MAGETGLDTQEASVSPTVVERVAEQTVLDGQDIVNALIELHPELLGRHAQYERAYDYVTVDGTRAYRVGDEEWDALADDFAFGDEIADAVRATHTEQARLLFARTVGADDQFREDEAGVVIGIDTAEEF